MAKKALVLVRPYIPRAETKIEDAAEAALDISEQLQGAVLAGVLFFCSPDYDLPTLSKTMQEAFDCPVIGCTTAGEIGMRYQERSIVGVGLPASLFQWHVHASIPLAGIWFFDAHARHSAASPHGTAARK